MREYETIQGDTWDGISYKLFGTEEYTSDLMELNHAHIRTVFFSAGVILMVPEVPPRPADDLPPWKRGG